MDADSYPIHPDSTASSYTCHACLMSPNALNQKIFFVDGGGWWFVYRINTNGTQEQCVYLDYQTRLSE